jgi:hypothetical protein
MKFSKMLMGEKKKHVTVQEVVFSLSIFFNVFVKCVVNMLFMAHCGLQANLSAKVHTMRKFCSELGTMCV